METGEAERTLLEIDRVRHRTRRALHARWFSNLVVGVFFLGATLTSAVADSATLPLVYWAVGIPLGLAAIVIAAVRRERALGAEAPVNDPDLAIFVAIVVAVVIVNRLTDSAVAWAYPVAAGWVAIGAVYRESLMTAAGVALAVIATVLLVAEPSGAGLWCQLALGLLLVGAGIAGRERA
jgi:hypothetical protein